MTETQYLQAFEIQNQINSNQTEIVSQQFLLERMELHLGEPNDPNLICVQPYTYPISTGRFYMKREYILQAIKDRIQELENQNSLLREKFEQI
jgi:hypothetical protein